MGDDGQREAARFFATVNDVTSTCALVAGVRMGAIRGGALAPWTVAIMGHRADHFATDLQGALLGKPGELPALQLPTRLPRSCKGGVARKVG